MLLADAVGERVRVRAEIATQKQDVTLRPNGMVGWKQSAVHGVHLSLFYPDSLGEAA